MQHLDPAGGAPMVARRVLGCSLLLLLAATAAALLIVGNDASTGAHVATAVGRAADLPAMLAPSGDAASSPLDATIRREVITNGDAPPRTFAQFVDALVDLGLETARLADAGQQDDAIASDHEARELFRAMLAAVADADAMALAAMADLPFDDRPLATAMLRSGADASATTAAPIVAPMQSRLLRENVLMLTLSCGLSRRHEHIVDGRPDSAALTAGALATLQALPHLAERLGDELLVDQPYLGESHEPQVLDIVARSSDGTFPAATSTALLSTLWTNLQHSGARSSEHLAGLALLLLDDGNASERMAAARLLILDERYREVVLDHVRRTKHEGLARTLAIAAAAQGRTIDIWSRVGDRRGEPMAFAATARSIPGRPQVVGSSEVQPAAIGALARLWRPFWPARTIGSWRQKASTRRRAEAAECAEKARHGPVAPGLAAAADTYGSGFQRVDSAVRTTSRRVLSIVNKTP